MGTFSASKRHKLKEYDNLSYFHLPLFLKFDLVRKVKKLCCSFKMVKYHHIPLVLSSHVSLSATSGETHSVVKLSLLP